MSTNYAASTAQTQYVDARSARFAHRRNRPARASPLVLLHRFRGTLDWWDPEFLDALSPDRDVSLFDNIGIGYTSAVRRPAVLSRHMMLGEPTTHPQSSGRLGLQVIATRGKRP